MDLAMKSDPQWQYNSPMFIFRALLASEHLAEEIRLGNV